MTECVLVADDLTGACDAAGPFASAGLRTVVALAAGDDAEVVSLSTGSRDVDPGEAEQRLEIAGEIARRLAPRVIFKKIDSTLRGNTRVEVAAALEAFDCDSAVVTPAFPAMGRVVEAGRLRITTNPDFAAIDLNSWFDGRFEIADAASDADLDRIADDLAGRGRRVLWVGSAGLAGALARRLRGDWKANPPLPRGKVMFFIGSDHPVTVEQLARLRSCRDADVVSVPMWGFAFTPAGPPPAAIFLCGGDTAALVCACLSVDQIEIVGEFRPGIPVGVLRGGPYDGVSVVTKSGGFGGPDDLIAVADYFSTL